MLWVFLPCVCVCLHVDLSVCSLLMLIWFRVLCVFLLVWCFLCEFCVFLWFVPRVCLVVAPCDC